MRAKGVTFEDDPFYARVRVAEREALAGQLECGRLPRPPARLIDLGCGDGAEAVRLAKQGFSVTGVDIAATALGQARDLAVREGVDCEFLLRDIVKLDLPAADFDLATDFRCLHMLVRDADRLSYLESVRRILKPGAAFFLFQTIATKRPNAVDEEEAIVRMVSGVETKTIEGVTIKSRSAGFRGSTLSEYQQELSGAGFVDVEGYAIKEGLDFAVLTATAPGG